MNFPESLFELRRDRGLSQEDLASQIGVSRQAVSKWETGEAMPDLNKLLLLADALGVSLDRLCGKAESLTEPLPTAPAAKKRSLWPILCGVLAILVVLLFLQTALFTAMFMVLPNHRYGFSASIPGALLSSIGWLVFSQLFSLYVEQLSNYGNLYGSVYALAISMLWLYFCLSILFYGGALNRLLINR